MILQEVIQRLIKELEESSTARIVPVHQPSEKARDEGPEDEDTTAREHISKDFT